MIEITWIGHPVPCLVEAKKSHWHRCVFMRDLRTKQSSDDGVFQKESSKAVLIGNSHGFGREAGTVSTVLIEQAWGQNLVPQHTNNISIMVHTCNPSTGEEKTGESIDLLASHSSQLGCPCFNERPCLKKQGRKKLRKTLNGSLLPPHHKYTQ